jgi:hypothetical protein
MLSINTQKTKGISIYFTCSDDISVDEYLKARMHVGRKSMLTCSNLKFVSSDDVEKFIDFMLGRSNITND